MCSVYPSVARPPSRLVVTKASLLGLGKPQHNSLFVFGLGYTGLAAASHFQRLGWSVSGTCRTAEKRQKLELRGIQTFHFDPSDYDNLSGKALDALRHATHVLSTVPPDSESDQDPVIMAHAQILSEHAEQFKWAGYISSTSVYGDYEGEWVDEESELRATGGKGWSRVMAEHEWLALHDTFGLPVHIFRCGGIYGPRRSAIEAVQKQAVALLSGDSASFGESASQQRRRRQQYTARCHVADICQTLEASVRHPRPGTAYNIVDDDPADRNTVMAYAAELLQRKAAGLAGQHAAAAATTATGRGLGPASLDSASASSDGSYDSGGEDTPPLLLRSKTAWEAAAAGVPALPRSRGSGGGVADWDSDDSSAGRRRERGWREDADAAAAAVRRLEEKRVRNHRIKEELGVKLKFPTYREGLAAIAAGSVVPFD